MAVLISPAAPVPAQVPESEVAGSVADEASLKEELLKLAKLEFQQYWPAYLLQEVRRAATGKAQLDKVFMAGSSGTVAGRVDSPDTLLLFLNILRERPVLAPDIRFVKRDQALYRFEIRLNPAFGEGLEESETGREEQTYPTTTSDDHSQTTGDQVAEARKRRSEHLQKFSERGDSKKISKSIRSGVSAAKLELVNFQVDAGETRPLYGWMTILVVAEGDWSATERFLRDLATLPFRVTVDELAVAATGGELSSVSADFTIHLIVPGAGESHGDDLPAVRLTATTPELLFVAVTEMKKSLGGSED